MTAALASRSAGALRGLYPFRPARDLGGVVPLLQLAFRDDLDSQDLAWLSDLGGLGSGNSWMRFILRLMPPGAGLFGGYVWYEEGRLIGNVSLMRAEPDVWVIANVATDPDYRRRGIGRALVGAAVDAARKGAARAVGLQVRHDNGAATNLYANLGFARVGSVKTYVGDIPDIDVPGSSPAIRVSSWTPGPASAARRVLAGAGALEGAWPPGPLRQSAQRRGIGGRLDDVFRGRDRLGWIATAGEGPCGVAVLYRERVEGHHLAEFAVLPAHRQSAEAPLLLTTFGALAAAGGPLRVEVPESETGVANRLTEWGFEPLRTLDRMVLRLV